MKTDVYTKEIPVPKGIEAIMGTIQWTDGYVVNASQYSAVVLFKDGESRKNEATHI